MRADKERLLHGVLLPLHGSAALGEYHGSLCMCIAHYIAHDSPVGAAAVCCCLLLLAAACCCLLLLAAGCCLLLGAACCCLLLLAAAARERLN